MPSETTEITITGLLLREAQKGVLPSEDPRVQFMLRAMMNQGMPEDEGHEALRNADSLATSILEDPLLEIVTGGKL